GKTMQDKLKVLRQETDRAVSAMHAQSTESLIAPDKMLRAIDGLAGLRQQVDTLAINNGESGTRFTDLIKNLIGFSYSLETSIEDPEILRGLSSLNQFVDMKERSG
ncbi:nitrate- and nitrite sensing domain-containing protein, partial [Pseudomonas viridiflava]|uniref:nitrate- and nitrite sensing domain-containing protein n=1 Tax=Pseudomonas viridiflava TaxID=33069 RepID=UPI0019809FD6